MNGHPARNFFKRIFSKLLFGSRYPLAGRFFISGSPVPAAKLEFGGPVPVVADQPKKLYTVEKFFQYSEFGGPVPVVTWPWMK